MQLLALALALAIVSSGCLGSKRQPQAPEADPDPAPELPELFHDERGEFGRPSTPEECGYVDVAQLATCIQYPFVIHDPATIDARLQWQGTADMAMWVNEDNAGVAETRSTGGQELRLQAILATPGPYILYVQAKAAYALDVQFAALPKDVPSAPLAAYLHDLSLPNPDWTPDRALVEQYRVAADDGVHLDTWVVRPDTPQQVPLVLFITPYYSGGAPVAAAPGEASPIGDIGSFLLKRGYAVGISSVRGTGNSEGCMILGGTQEAVDSAAVIESLAKESWSNGRVGVIGVSYEGTTAQDVWVEAPPALKAVVPVSAISDFYKYGFVNGVPSYNAGHAFNLYFWLYFGLVTAPGSNEWKGAVADANAVPALAGEACDERVTITEGGQSSALDGNKDAYWQERDFLAELRAEPAKDRAAVFYVHGLSDWNVKPSNMEDWLDAVQASGAPFKAWLGQWDHSFPKRTDWRAAMLAWFDQFLKGIDTGILDAPKVQVSDDDGIWRHEAHWPPSPAGQVQLHPNGDGTLGAAPGSGTASYVDVDANGILFGYGLPTAPANNVVWVSDPLPEDLHLSGQPTLDIAATSSGSRASMLLTLLEVRDSGQRPFNYGAISLNHVASLEAGDPDISGQTQAVHVRFFPQDDVVHAGSRIMLVAGPNFEFAGATCNQSGSSCPAPDLQPIGVGSTVTLDLDGAMLVLPFVTQLVAELPQPSSLGGSIA